MADSSNSLLAGFKSDVYSRSSEEVIIQKILEIFPQKDKWCVEFGAWDGKHLSNTASLIENHGYHAILIEGGKRKFRDLQKNYANNPNVIAINKFVGFKEEDNLDNLAKSHQGVIPDWIRNPCIQVLLDSGSSPE